MGKPEAPRTPLATQIIYATFGGAECTDKIKELASQGEGFELKIDKGGYCGAVGSDPYPNEYKTMAIVVSDDKGDVRVHLFEEDQECKIVQGPGISTDRGVTPSVQDVLYARYGDRDVTKPLEDLLNRDGYLRFERVMVALKLDGEKPENKPVLLVVYKTTHTDGRPARRIAFYLDGESVTLKKDGAGKKAEESGEKKEMGFLEKAAAAAQQVVEKVQDAVAGEEKK